MIDVVTIYVFVFTCCKIFSVCEAAIAGDSRPYPGLHDLQKKKKKAAAYRHLATDLSYVVTLTSHTTLPRDILKQFEKALFLIPRTTDQKISAYISKRTEVWP